MGCGIFFGADYANFADFLGLMAVDETILTTDHTEFTEGCWDLDTDGLVDGELEVPVDKAKAFADFIQERLESSNIKVTRSKMEIILSMGPSENTREDLGY